MSRADLIISSRKEQKELETIVKSINFYYEVSCERLGIKPGEDRGGLTPELRKKAEEYFAFRTHALKTEVITYMDLGYTEE